MVNVSPKSDGHSDTEGASALGELLEMASLIDSQPDWWRFPEEKIVKGFMGIGRLFIVGDQPSTSPWEFWYPNRRALYDLLPRVGAADAHITDLYKRRGRAGSLRHGLPPDLSEHIEIFRKELALLKPTRVVALGHLAYKLLSLHVPEVRPILGRMWHFAYVVRYGKLDSYMSNMLAAFDIGAQCQPNMPEVADSKTAPHTAVSSGYRTVSPRSQGMCVRVQAPPRGARLRRWTLRADNNGHHHGIVRHSESLLYLDLSWRATAADTPQRVGLFRFDLDALQSAGCIRSEPGDSDGADVRLRIVRTADGNFYVQANQQGPRIRLAAN